MQLEPTRDEATALARSIDSFRILDVYAGGVSDEAPRLDAIATISAGYREAGKDGHAGLPKASRDGRIYLHDRTGRAPGLKAALEATGYRRLTIAFPLDDPHAFIQQRFVAYSSTNLLAYGDEHLITEIRQGKHIPHAVGTEGYQRLVASCKVAVSVYFCLAQWGDDAPEVIFPDGLGYYRLRFTSRHSLRAIVSSLQHVAKFTRGRIAGIPFDLSLDYREVSGPDGSKRVIPVWVLVTKPPAGITLSSRTFARIMQASLAQGEALMLPAPSQETVAHALQEPPEPDLDEADMSSVHVGGELIDRQTGEVVHAQTVDAPSDTEADLLARGGRCDKRYWTKRWHAIAKGTPYESDEARAVFLDEYTGGRTISLAEFLEHATEAEASDLIEALERRLRAPGIMEARLAEGDEDLPEDDEPAGVELGEPSTPEPVQPAQPPAGSGKRPSDRMWDRWESLRREAQALGLDPPIVSPDIDALGLQQAARALRDQIDLARIERAEQEEREA